MSKLKADTLANRLDTQSIGTERVINGSAFAWVNFNGTGTVAIRASYNVSSITDNALGDYTVNFTVAAPDANYAMTSSAGNAAANELRAAVPGTLTAAAAPIKTGVPGGALTDPLYCLLAFFR